MQKNKHQSFRAWKKWYWSVVQRSIRKRQMSVTKIIAKMTLNLWCYSVVQKWTRKMSIHDSSSVFTLQDVLWNKKNHTSVQMRKRVRYCFVVQECMIKVICINKSMEQQNYYFVVEVFQDKSHLPAMRAWNNSAIILL